MHMADALISPAVGGTMWAASAGLIGYCAKKVKDDLDDRKIPLMGVVGAFIFAAQMINFAIPGTGSSGHIGGGMILAILLGPYAAFLTMASVLIIQALFFADGGLLALGCNIFNLGFFPCFLAYPLIYKPMVTDRPTDRRLFAAAALSALFALQLGAFSVVLQTVLSGLSELPFRTFVLFMQPIHLAIGLVEGLATTAGVIFVWKSRPEIIQAATTDASVTQRSFRKVLIGLVVATVITGGMLSWFASSHPDGLEWSIFKTSGGEALSVPRETIHSSLEKVQEKTALLPDYAFKDNPGKAPAENPETWPAHDGGTTVAGLVGGAITLVLAASIGYALKRRKR
jgi:cobalt/nickel transport system permease protein